MASAAPSLLGLRRPSKREYLSVGGHPELCLLIGSRPGEDSVEDPGKIPRIAAGAVPESQFGRESSAENPATESNPRVAWASAAAV